MKIDIVSVFPEYFKALNIGLFGRAIEHGLLDVKTHDLRDWTHDVHHSVDDTPVGGGAGMVMKPEVWAECLDDLLGLEPVEIADSDGTSSVTKSRNETTFSNSTQPNNTSDNDDATDNLTEKTETHTDTDTDTDTDAAQSSDATIGGKARPDTKPILIFPNPSAPLFTQRDATELSRAGHLVFGCGRYEGYDARIPRYYRAQGIDVREYSIGDYVLNGGEVAVSVMLEAITRLMPGFMGNPESIVEESYTGSNALLEHYQYTKPAVWRGMSVPDVLTSGDHGKVDRFRRDEAIAHTDSLRPDLIGQLDCKSLDKADRKTLMSLGWEVSGSHPRKLDN
ncbi:tRNA (guanosine(37)-N1)-methyltransferase TrmD [Bifidobacterium sp. ESL0732]|uniref:tRNA (guanosine(37)-N1)-methyltransferase TrmD n=1 Tax=Bifidobacterium sp. ESL0732 TaxID=2983222 RepID=UPI0023FA3D3A|nr:tRNA (guanosine(37)-N1)-methyltransferase TrmD [Bifidobacterium sp. ESL0732]WEV64964.1 tRNA (guanosine(37)-N1)-methyltransferase TrmD [Bifidobacterium sp. ESL0732]